MKCSLNFTNHMTRAAEHHVVHFAFGIFQRASGGVAQGSHSEDLCGGFALGAAAGVFAVGKLVSDIAVGNEQLDGGVVHGHKLGFARAAIQQQEMVFAPHDGNKLVHDAAGNTGKFMLGFLAQQRFFNGIHFFAGDGFPQRCGADFESGAAGKPAAQRNRRMQQHVQTAGIDPIRQKSGNNTAWIITPFGRAGFDRRGKINQHRFDTGGIADLDHVPAVGGLVGGHDGITVYGHRHDKAVVVIGVLADDVDATWRGNDPARGASISLCKLLGNLNCQIQIRHVVVKVD